MPADGGGRPVVDLRGVTRTYTVGGDPVRALNGIDLVIPSGEYLAIVGSSGSGKSTLMNVLGCLDLPDAGSYWLEGADTSTLNPSRLADIRGRRIGFVFQSFNLLPRETALANVMRPLVYQGVPRVERRARAEIALDRVGLGRRSAHLPNQLSGGQRQRVAIARALCSEPALLIADEPTGNLDSGTSADILKIFDRLSADGTTIVMVTHEADVASRAARIVTMADGAIAGDRRA